MDRIVTLIRKIFLAYAVFSLLSVTGLFQCGIAYAGGKTDTAARSQESALLSKAKEWFWRFENDNIDRSQLDDETNLQLTSASVQQEGTVLRRFGEPTQFTYLGSTRLGIATAYNFLIKFKSGRIVESLAFGVSGKIVGIDFQTFVPKR